MHSPSMSLMTNRNRNIKRKKQKKDKRKKKSKSKSKRRIISKRRLMLMSMNNKFNMRKMMGRRNRLFGLVLLMGESSC